MPRSRNRRTSQSTDFGGVFLFLFIVLLVGSSVIDGIFTVLSSPLFWLSIMVLMAGLVAFWFWRRKQRMQVMQRRVEYQQQLQRYEYQRQQEEVGRNFIFSQNIGNLLALTPRDFELRIGSLLQAYGYQQVRHTGGSGDLAADLQAISPQGEYLVVQCKRYAPGKRIGTPEIQKFIGMMTVHHRVQRGIFVTTSSYTAQAQTLAQQHNVQLIDGQQLTSMFAQVGGVRGYPQLSS